MKHIAYKTLLAAVCVALAGCEDTPFLQVETESGMDESIIFSKVETTEGQIASIYHVMGETNAYRNNLTNNMGVNTDIELQSGSADDDAATGDNRRSLAVYMHTAGMVDNWNASDGKDPFSQIYSAIERCNNAVEGIKKYGNPQPGTHMGALYAEALTLRAFFYFDLIKYWGDVPARFEPLTMETAWIPKSDRVVIYNHILNDLAIADEYGAWPGEYSYTTVERANRGFAKALRARVAMSAAGKALVRVNRDFENPYTAGGDPGEINWVFPDEARRTELWGIVKTETEELLASGYYNLPTDRGSFEQFWRDIMSDVISVGRESIFEIGFRTGRGRVAHTFGAFHEDADKYVAKKVSPYFVASPIYYYRFQEGDVRRDVTVVPYKYVKSDKKLTGNADGFQTISSINKMYFGKFRAEYRDIKSVGILTNAENDEGINFPVMRVADVVLMAAEANCMLEDQGAALGYLQQIRRRAFGGDGAMDKIPYNIGSKSGMLKAIKDERMFEFAEELIRKQDLIRWGELKEAMDIAKEETAELRECIGDFCVMMDGGEPRTVYYRLKSDGETLEYHNIDPYEDTFTPGVGEEWQEAKWTNGESNDVPYLSDEYIGKVYYQGDPDKRQLMPIMSILIAGSQYTLVNDYGY